MKLFVEKLSEYRTFAINNGLIIEYIGLNFLTSTESLKVYYRPDYSLINCPKNVFTEELLKKYFGDKLAKLCEKYLLKGKNYHLLDISFKTTKSYVDTRCSIKVSEKYNNISSIYSFLTKIGFIKTIDEITRIREYIHLNNSVSLDPLYVIGFNYRDEKITSLKTYYRFSKYEIVDDYANFDKHRMDDCNIFKNIVTLCEISENLENKLYQFFLILNKAKFFIDFMGVDFSLDGDKFFKIYFKNSGGNCADNAIRAILDLSNNREYIEEIFQSMRNLCSSNFKIDGIGIAFNKERVLKYQIYLRE